MDLPDSHLQSAIRGDERKFTFRSSLIKCPIYLQPYLSTCPIPREQIQINSECQYGNILATVYNSEFKTLNWVKRHLPSAFEVSGRLVTQCLTHLIPGLTLPKVRSDEYICKLISVCTVWEDLRSHMQSMVSSPGVWTPGKKRLGVIEKYFISGKFMLMYINNQWYALGYDQVMMISDTIWARCNVLMYHHLLPSSLPSKVPPIYIEACYSIFDQEFESLGNTIYDGIKNWEPIILGALVEDYDPYDGGKDYIIPVLKEMDESNFKFVRSLYNYIKTLNLKPDQYSELHGLNRHWGHPTVDEPGACHKTRLISQHRPVPKLSTIIDSVGCLKRQFIVSFIQKHGRWPCIINTKEIKNKILLNMIKTHARHLNLYQSGISLEDWYNIEFGKEMDFDYHPDYTELLEDKAISPYRNEYQSLFNPAILGYRPRKPARSRRLLRAVLEITELDIEKIIIKIRKREVPPEWFIVILHSKERELKIKPRLFAMLVLEMRMYFSVTEKNIAENVFGYYPQQTMTMSESELSKRIYKFTEKSSGQTYIPFYIMIDFKSWNIHWSKMSTDDVFRMIDRLHGLSGVYTFTHEFFEMCLTMLSSPLLPPESIRGKDGPGLFTPEECATLWYNHMGGWDGQRQKGWTLATIGLLLLVEAKTGIQSQVVGQADNQICKVLIPRDTNDMSDEDYIMTHLEEIRSQINLFTNTLDEVVKDMGLVLKKEESLVSSVLTIYGKEMTYKGAQLSQASKKISRALAEVNIAVPSLYSKTLTIHSAGLSTAQKTHTPVIPCILANTLSLINFINGARYSLLSRRKNPAKLWDWIEGENALTFLLLSSGDTGGIPVQNILNYLYRGHPDSLTAYTTYLYHLSSHNIMAKKMYIYLQSRLYPIGDADPELLISNPCSTNISSFPLVSSRYRRKLETLVQGKTRNHALNTLFPMSSQKDDKETFEFLLQFRPIQPRLLHEIFRLTPTCSRLTFLAKFSNTRTIYSMLKEEMKSSPTLDPDVEFEDFTLPTRYEIKVDDVDSGMLSHLKIIYDEVRCIRNTDVKLICPTLLAKDIRQYSWKDLIGENILEGVTIPHPSHQFILSLPEIGSHDDCVGDTEYCILSPITLDNNIILTSRGPLPPYIGSITREKVTGKIYSVPTSARPFKAAERAILLDDWCIDPTSSLHLYLRNIVESRTDMSYNDLKQVAGRVTGGTPAHRLKSASYRMSTLNNSVSNYTTHILFSTDTMGKFSQGRENYAMHFQGIIHIGLSYFNIYISHNNKVPVIGHLHYAGQCCEELIEETLVGGYASPPLIPTFPENPLLYTRIKNIPTSSLEIMKGVTISDHADSSWAMAFILLSRIRTRILTGQWGITETSAPTVSSLGVQEILRIGIKRIVKSLSLLLYLHLDYDDCSMELLLQSLSHDIWSDIANIVLIPDVLVPTMDYLNLDGVPDAYTNPSNISRGLNRKLIMEVLYYSQHPNKVFSVKPFHIYGNIKLPHILRMWGKIIYIKSDSSIDLRNIINNALLQDKTYSEDSSSLTSSISAHILARVIQDFGVKGFLLVWKDHPLKISYIPPETLLRIDPFPKRLKSEKISPYSVKSNLYEPYPYSISMVPRSDMTQPIGLTYCPGIGVYNQKLRADHLYRTRGQVSTAYLKYMEILIKENIPLKGTAICTADGESSVGFLLYKLTGNPIIYNSLVNRNKTQPQRGYIYIPGSFLKYPTGILNLEENCLLGGDITNYQVQDQIIKQAIKLDTPICILTCDAESSIDFSLNTTMEILLAICYISYKVQSQNAIIKTYMLDGEVLAYQGGYLQLIWEDVKLVTPTYSSYESTECFWVCKSYNPIYDISNIQDMWKITKCIPIPISCHQTIPFLIDYKSSRSESQQPYQQLYSHTTNVLLKESRLLGFRSNIPQAFELVTNNLIHYDPSLPLERNLNDGKDRVHENMYKYLKGTQQVYEGKSLEIEYGAGIMRSKVLHSSIESYIVAYRNIILILKLIEYKYLLDKANQLIHEHSSTATPIQDTKGRIIYSYQDSDENAWRQKYLKSVWKLLSELSLI